MPQQNRADSHFAMNVHIHIQQFRERLSGKVHATTLKGIVGGSDFTVFQRNLKKCQERPWTYGCKC